MQFIIYSWDPPALKIVWLKNKDKTKNISTEDKNHIAR